MMAYRDIVPIGTSLIIGAASFGLGVVYSSWPYDVNTLWKYQEGAVEKSIAHYQQWANSPMYVHYTLHFVAGLGLLGSFIKLYKPNDDAKYFEYGSLGLLMVGVIIYLTNLRTGVNSCISGNWGEVDVTTGVNVMAASQVMIVFALVGVLVLQAGLYYAEWYENKLKEEFYKEEAAEAAAAAENQAREEEEAQAETQEEEKAEASGSARKTKQTARKRKS
ncbi:Secretory component protein SHR3 [Spathaspora sp. JA1]|nr:Secretory component protein SHR3 [Spathaspora sp. JA1]